ncbi:MAG: hypothetical protein HN465_02075 [Nitrospina sp.]|nr:hypothetical protein [Nitrospina sp.]MBT4127914.1 hypothetical protein [Nitrospina sp.]MBT5968269.1 hypothetical protein [Nitrospina sp.]
MSLLRTTLSLIALLLPRISGDDLPKKLYPSHQCRSMDSLKPSLFRFLGA